MIRHINTGLTKKDIYMPTALKLKYASKRKNMNKYLKLNI